MKEDLANARQFMELAVEEARKGMHAGKGGPFGAVVVKDGKVISIASNEVLSSSDPTAHAEIVAIRRAGTMLKTYDLTGCVLYTTGEPCPMCFSAIVWANIQEVYYGAPMEEADTLGFRDTKIAGYFRGEECCLTMTRVENAALKELYEEYRTTGKTIY